jgi:hypothetical protein
VAMAMAMAMHMAMYMYMYMYIAFAPTPADGSELVDRVTLLAHRNRWLQHTVWTRTDGYEWMDDAHAH